MSSHLRAIIATLPLLLPATGCIHDSETARPDKPPAKTRRSPASNSGVSARDVEILGALPPREDLIPVGEVECGAPEMIWETDPTWNARACRAELRRQAREQGASVVVLVTQQVGIGQCVACMYLYGTAYRRANPKPKADTQPGATTPGATASP